DWADSAGHWRDERCDFLHAREIHVAVQLAICTNTRGHIDHHCARLHQIGCDLILLTANRSHDDVAGAHEAVVIFFACVAMAPDRGRVAHASTEHVMNRLGGDVVAAHDYRDPSFGFDPVEIEHAPDGERCGRKMKHSVFFGAIEFRNG